jgi:SAM-dependent methyltransferase
MSGRSRRDAAAEKARRFFDGLWSQEDPWGLEASPFEAERHRRQLELVSDRRYERALEIGCGAGAFTAVLAPLADHLLALDVSPAAIERARARRLPDVVELRVVDVVDEDEDLGAPWDLVVLSETVYYLGWLYPFFDVAWLAARLFEGTRSGGRLLLSNTQGMLEDWLVRPWVIRTYHDLFRNVGFEVEHEEVVRGVKDGVELEVLTSLLVRR